MNRRVLVNLTVFMVIFGVMCVWAVRNVVTIDRIERPYEISGDFAAASGVSGDAEVAYLGVHYGRVSAVDLIDGGVRIEMLIDRDRHIPEGSVARIFRKSAIGEPYIDFQPPADFDPNAEGVTYLEAGDHIPMELTKTPLEFSELLRTASDLLSHVDPERANVLIHELALALDGRTESLRQLTIAGDQLAATFAEHTEELDRLAVNQTALTHVLAEHRSSIGSSVNDLALLADTLARSSGDTRVLLDRGTALLDATDDLLVDIRPDLDCLLDNLVIVNERAAQPEQLEGLRHLLDVGPHAFDLLASTRDFEPDGPWVRVNLQLEPENPPLQHVPPLDLPPVPAQAPCPGQGPAGTAAAAVGPRADADFVPADYLLADPAPSPAPVAVVAAGAAHLAGAGTGMVARHRRRTGGTYR